MKRKAPPQGEVEGGQLVGGGFALGRQGLYYGEGQCVYFSSPSGPSELVMRLSGSGEVTKVVALEDVLTSEDRSPLVAALTSNMELLVNGMDGVVLSSVAFLESTETSLVVGRRLHEFVDIYLLGRKELSQVCERSIASSSTGKESSRGGRSVDDAKANGKVKKKKNLLPKPLCSVKWNGELTAVGRRTLALVSGQLVEQIELAPGGGRKNSWTCVEKVTAVAVSPDDSQICVAVSNGALHWLYAGGGEKTIIHWHDHAVTALKFSPLGDATYSADEKGFLAIWTSMEAGRILMRDLGAPVIGQMTVPPPTTDPVFLPIVAVTTASNSLLFVDTSKLTTVHTVFGMQSSILPPEKFAFGEHKSRLAIQTRPSSTSLLLTRRMDVPNLPSYETDLGRIDVLDFDKQSKLTHSASLLIRRRYEWSRQSNKTNWNCHWRTSVFATNEAFRKSNGGGEARKHLVVGEFRTKDQQYQLGFYRYDTTTDGEEQLLKPVNILSHPAMVTAISFLSESLVLLGDEDGGLNVWRYHYMKEKVASGLPETWSLVGSDKLVRAEKIQSLDYNGAEKRLLIVGQQSVYTYSLDAETKFGHLPELTAATCVVADICPESVVTVGTPGVPRALRPDRTRPSLRAAISKALLLHNGLLVVATPVAIEIFQGPKRIKIYVLDEKSAAEKVTSVQVVDLVASESSTFSGESSTFSGDSSTFSGDSSTFLAVLYNADQRRTTVHRLVGDLENPQTSVGRLEASETVAAVADFEAQAAKVVGGERLILLAASGKYVVSKISSKKRMNDDEHSS